MEGSEGMKVDELENKGITEIKLFCAKYGIAVTELAMHLGVTWTRIYEIMSGKRRITPDTDLRLCKFFGLERGYFAELQLEYDLLVAERNLSADLDKLKNVNETVRSGN